MSHREGFCFAKICVRSFTEEFVILLGLSYISLILFSFDLYGPDENILPEPPSLTEPCYTLHFARADKDSIFHRNTLKRGRSSL